MDTTEKFILGKSLNKSSKDDNMSLNLSVSGNKKILPDASIDSVINSYDVYLNERANSNKFRLTVSINPYCSNILFNPFTEIIKYYKVGDIEKIYELPHYSINEGDTTADLIEGGVLNNYSVIGKEYNRSGSYNNNEFKWNTYKAIRDTQLSNKKCGFEYFCGVDIFNNHILRNKTYKSVTYSDKSDISIMKYNDSGVDYGVAYDSFVNGNSLLRKSYRYIIDEDFNTIDDYLRDRNGVVVSDNVIFIINTQKYAENNCPLHLYQKSDIISFEDAIITKLIEKNGWFGFLNKSLIDTSTLVRDADVNNDINLAINNKKYGEFIDMYPTRDLYSFSPLYNKHKKRLEKNWKYFLTYPSESIIKMLNGNDFPFFHISHYNNKETVGLKILMIDEYTVYDDGRSTVTIYSICQHGLVVGDKINLYVKKDKEELFYESAEVVYVYDKYIFQILKTEGNISNKWVDLSIETGNTITLSDGRTLYYVNDFSCLSDGNKKYPIAESDRCNVDESINDIFFKRVVNNVECEYYVRLFSRLPNFKFADSEISDETLYGEKSYELNLIERYSSACTKNEFENHVSDESFAKTSYGDSDTEIVFTDDIDVSFLRDNLGRPLSDIYITILKNNKGYKEWYGIDMARNINDKSIELSHCFGKNSSSFILSEYYRKYIKDEPSKLNDIHDISVKQYGLFYSYGNDEINDESTKFYGDLCCYSPIDCDEQSIQTVHNRFNTAQRELSDYNARTYFYKDDKTDKEGVLYYDVCGEDENDESEIIYATSENGRDRNYLDFYSLFNRVSTEEDNNKRHSSYSKYLLDGKDMTSYNGLTAQREGYFYKSHYKIKLKTISETLNSAEPISFNIYKIFNKNKFLHIKTNESNYLEINDKLILYIKDRNEFYYLTVRKINDEKYFECVAENENYEECYVDDGYIGDIENIYLLQKPEYVPYYAKIVKDGSCRYYWRNVISNGIESGDSKIYPFTNGAFYVNKRINFYLKRQSPFYDNNYNSISNYLKYVPDGEMFDAFETDNYYEPGEIENCNFDLKELLKV